MFFIATPKGSYTRTEVTAEIINSFFTRVANRQLELDSITFTYLSPIYGEREIIGYCQIERKEYPVIELQVTLDNYFRWNGIAVVPLELFEGGLSYKHNPIIRTSIYKGSGIGRLAHVILDGKVAISLVIG